MANRNILAGVKTCPYIGFLLDEQAMQKIGSKTHTMELKRHVFIDPRGTPDVDNRIVVDVGFMALCYPECMNMASAHNTVASFQTNLTKTNCKICKGSTQTAIMWVVTDDLILKGICVRLYSCIHTPLTLLLIYIIYTDQECLLQYGSNYRIANEPDSAATIRLNTSDGYSLMTWGEAKNLDRQRVEGRASTTKKCRKRRHEANCSELLQAASTGKPSDVKWVLNSDKRQRKSDRLPHEQVDVNDRHPQTGETPLFMAVAQKDEEKVKLLVSDPRVNRSLPNKSGISPLVMAVRKQSVAIVALLALPDALALSEAIAIRAKYKKPASRQATTADSIIQLLDTKAN